MAQWLVTNFGGEIPLQDARILGDTQAIAAWNTDLASGRLEGLPVPELVRDLSASPGVVKRAYRFPGPRPTLDPDVWLALPSPFSSVVRGPLANDTLHRIYWTNPDGDGGFWNTYARIAASLPPYTLGFLPVEAYWIPVAVASGGTAPGTVPYVARSYIFTYVDQYGQESSPSVPSAVVEGASDGTWTVFGLSNVPPTSFTSAFYPTVTKIRIYRTIVGATTGGNFYMVAEILIPPGVDPSLGWVDTALDVDIVNNAILESTSWAPPPAGLDGLTQLPGGMLVGFTENTLHFCEPNRPNVWPSSYDLSVNYQIVGLAVWQASLVVLTQGFPSTGSGSNPANFALSQVQVAEPCIARGSIVTDLLGVYYAGPNGLIMLNYYGMQNTTIKLLTKNQWLVDFAAGQLIACRHRSQYLALNAIGSGFQIDFGDPRSGLVQLNTFSAAVSLWNDAYSGDSYIMAGKKVYRWDSPNTARMLWRWRSKRWSLAVPISLGACQVTLTPEILATPVVSATPLDNGDPALELPVGVNALFRLYAGTHLVMEKILTKEVEIFRIPGGFKTFDWQWEIVAQTPVLKVELASTMHELKGV